MSSHINNRVDEGHGRSSQRRRSHWIARRYIHDWHAEKVSRRWARWWAGAGLMIAAVARPGSAQTPVSALESLTAAASVITAAEVARHLGVLARDSMRGGDVASRAREVMARYVADQWDQLDLGPDPRTKARVQRYSLPGQRRFNYALSRVQVQTVLGGGLHRVWDELGNVMEERSATGDFVATAYFVPEAGPVVVKQTVFTRIMADPRPEMTGSPRTLVVAGPHTPATLAQLDLSDIVVFYVPPVGADSAARQRVLAELYARSRGVLLVGDADSASFARQLQAARQAPITMVDGYMLDVIARRPAWPWAIALRPSGFNDIWGAAGMDTAALRVVTTPVARELPGTEAWLMVVAAPDSSATPAPRTAPNVIGLLEGTDSLLRREYVVIASSLTTPDDNATGLAGLLALARAFSQPGARPQRSVLFVATSGEAQDFSGSWFFAGLEQRKSLAGLPGQMVAALTIDGLPSSTGTSVMVAGGSEVALAEQPTWVTAAHPELGLAVVDTGTVFQPGRAAYAFASNGVPTLAVQVPSPAGAPSSDLSRAVGTSEPTARALQLAFYLGQGLANGPKTPKWTAIGRQRYRTVLLGTVSEEP